MSSTRPSQEVRLAIVLYGGVSLAVYINGVVQELLRLVRATSDPDAVLPERGSERVYRELGSILERERIPSPDAHGDGTIRTKFLIDIISGTSAGGINGIFLAKALANDSDLTPIEHLWFDEGDIGKLLNDADSYSDLRIRPSDPASLLNSRRMYSKLLDAFDLMDGGAGSGRRAVFRSKLAENIDLFATTTDIEGVPVPIRLFDNVVYERRHRNAFRLRFATDERNDFQPDNNPFLAFTARCTSSFPFAFEPMQLCSIDEVLAPHPHWSPKSYCHSGSSRWQKYYTNYLQGVLPGTTPFPQRSFGDGGYLNNAPFSYAVDALLDRQSVVPVDRKLLYVEPSPSHVEELPGLRRPPNAIENSLAALVTIPGYQVIRNDLMRVLDRNVAVSKINKTVGEIEARIQGDAERLKMPEDGKLAEIWFQDDACYQAYYQMRAAEITDLLTSMVARARGIEEDSAFFQALRAVIRAWREEVYAIDPRSGRAADTDGLQRFLRHFDLPYRMRRLRFVLRKLDTLHALGRSGATAGRQAARRTVNYGMATADAIDAIEGLADVHARVATNYKLVAHILQHVLERRDPDDTHTPKDQLGEVPHMDPAGVVRDILPPRDQILSVLCEVLGMDPRTVTGKWEESADAASSALGTQQVLRRDEDPVNADARLEHRAADILRKTPEIVRVLRDVGERLTALLADVLNTAHEASVGGTASTDADTIARRYYHTFDLFDSAQYPMTFGTNIGEADVVEIIRVCPEDAQTLVPGLADRRRKLRGLVAAHFGAFLERDWRVSDLLWGRLDAAERIITSMLPWESTVPLRDRLIDEAQLEIVRTFEAQKKLGEMATRQAVDDKPEAGFTPQMIGNVLNAVLPPLAPPSRDRLQQFMRIWDNVVPRQSNRVALMRTLARSTQIVGEMLEGMSADRQVATPGRWLTRVGRILWGVVEISVPRSVGALLGKYWASLALLIGILLVVLGLVSERANTGGVGWMILGFAVAISVARSALHSFMSGNSLWRRVRIIALAAVALILVAGLVQSWEWGQAVLDWIGSRIQALTS